MSRLMKPTLTRPIVGLARGFTLLELLITLVIMGILASIGLPLTDLAQKRQQEDNLRIALRDIRSALDAYKKAVDEGHIVRKANEAGYPAQLDDLVSGMEDAKSPDHQKIKFLRRIPRDPFADQTVEPASATWGKRSYASTLENPQEGADVYDVYSLAEGTGMNGIPYHQW